METILKETRTHGEGNRLAFSAEVPKEESKMKRCMVALVALSLAVGTAWAQDDDFDLDALLGDAEAGMEEFAGDAADVAEVAEEEVAEAVDVADEAAGDIAEFGDEALDDFADIADETAAEAADFADEAADEFAATAEEAADDAAEIADDAAEDFAGFDEEIPAEIADVSEEAVEEVAEVADDATDDLADFADDAAEDFGDFGDEAAAEVADLPEDAVEDVAEDVAEDFTEIAEEAPVAEEVDDFGDMFATTSEPEAAPADDFAAADDDFGAAEDDFDGTEDFASDEEFGNFDAEDEAAEPAAKADTPKLSAEDLDALVKATASDEEIRRQRDDQDARKASEAGFHSLKDGDYAAADASFTSALAKLPARPQTQDLRDQISWGLAEAKYLRARGLMESEEGYPEARTLLDAAMAAAPGHLGAKELSKKLEKKEAEAARPKPPKRQRGTVDKQAAVGKLYDEARQWYALKDYAKARELFDQILVLDPSNVSAMRYIRALEKKRYNLASRKFEANREGMVAQVRETFSPPLRAKIDLPNESEGGTAVDSRLGGDKLNEKMQNIIIKSIEFRQANINDVVNFLVEASRENDPEGEGVNIILNLGESAASPAPAAAPQDEFGGWGDEFGGDDYGMDMGASSGSVGGVSPITLNLRRISMLDAIKYITEVAGLKYRIEDTAVIITRQDAPVGKIITRMYPVQPSFIDVVIERQGATADERNEEFVGLGGRVQVTKSDVQEFFEKTGVKFPAGASITYNATISQLIVTNTADNLENFERILQRLNVVPNQVEIEARFIEIGQNDLEELGFQWILNDNWEMAAQKNGPGSVQMNANANGVTQGLRFFHNNSDNQQISPASPLTKIANQTPIGNIASFASVLTNPDVTLIIQALSQHGGNDLLSAPKVTTRSGVNAQIQVVKEIIYPTEFDSEIITIDQETEGGATWQQLAAVSTPGSFETRETGVILNVTPTVGPDGYTIDLVMAPEVCELADWIQYGGAVGDYFFNQPMPVFTSRNVTTSLVVWDGQTVVMGGLIREELVTVKDKIPILGDIPLLGWLFRSEGSYSQKKNLLIFVTARLVDPAGRPVHQEGALLPGEGTDMAEAEDAD